MRKAAGITTIVLALAAAAAQPVGAHPTIGTCPAKTVAGGKWTVLIARGVSCGAAYGVVGRLATRKVPAGRVFSGTYAGMRCFAGPKPGALPRSIVCGTASKTHVFSAFKGL